MTELTIINYVNNWRTANGITGSSSLTDVQLRSFVGDLQSQVQQFAVRPSDASWATDARPIAYSGMLGDTPSFQLAKAISEASGGKLFFISDTPAGELLNSTGLEDAVAKAVGGTDTDLGAKVQARIFRGDWSGSTRTSKYAVGDLLALDDFISDRMIGETAWGDLRTITATSQSDRVFAQTELIKAMAEPKITSINTVPKEVYQAIYDKTGSWEAVNDAVSAASFKLQQGMRWGTSLGGNLVIDTAGFLSGNGYSGSTLPIGTTDVNSVAVDLNLSMSADTATRLGQGWRNLGIGAKAVALTKGSTQVLGVAGIAITAYRIADMVDNAEEAYSQGDTAKSAKILADGSTQIGAGWATGIAASAFAAGFFVALLPATAVGLVAATVLTVATGALAGSVAESVVKQMLDGTQGKTSSTSPITSPKNPSIFDLSTDPTLKPSGTSLGSAGLLGAGSGYRYTMDSSYVQGNGLDKAAPSAMATNGQRVGNKNLSSVEQQMSEIRQTWRANTSATEAFDTGAGIYLVGNKTSTTEWLSLITTGADGQEHKSTTFEAIVRYDGQGKVLGYTPTYDQVVSFVDDAGHPVIGKNGKPLGSYTMLANTTTVAQNVTVDADGAWRVTKGQYTQTQTGAALQQVSSAPQTAYTDPLILDTGAADIAFAPILAPFDTNADGVMDALPVSAPSDPWLVMDLDGNGRINNGTELVDLTNDRAPLNLLGQDGNGDGILDARDAAFNKLQLWSDTNWDGYASAEERQSLASLGIASVDLLHPVSGNVAGHTAIKGLTVTYADSTAMRPHTSVLWDIPLTDPSTTSTAPTTLATSSASIVKLVQSGSASPQAALMAMDGRGVTIDLNSADATSGVKAIEAIGANGNDVLTGTAEGNWLIGNAGADTFKGGAGADLLVIDADDQMRDIDGGTGIDTVVVADERGVVLNLAQTNTEIVYGGYGNDVFIGGGADNYFIEGASGKDIIIGGTADDVLSGQDGDDDIDGGAGDDLIRGGRGGDVLYGGAGGDVIEGGLGDDWIDAGANDDVVIAGGGHDMVDGGSGTDIYHLNGTLDSYKIETIDAHTYKLIDLRAESPDGTAQITNFEKITFSLGGTEATVNLGTDQPLTANDQLVVSPDTSGNYVIPVATLIGNDLDFQGDALHVTSVLNAFGGQVKIVGTNVVFTPTAGFAGTPSFQYKIADSKGNAAITLEQTDAPGTFAEMKGTVYLKTSTAPSDPDYVKQYYLNEVGADKVWPTVTGKGVSVLVLEPGGKYAIGPEYADLSTPDLAPNAGSSFLASKDLTKSQHATLVASIIGAARNDIGGVGVAYNAQLNTVSLGGGTTVDASWYAKQIGSMTSYDVVNNSWGQADDFFPDQLSRSYDLSAIRDAATHGRGGKGSIVVIGSGNSRQLGEDTGLTSLTSNPYSITVGAINYPADLGAGAVTTAEFSTPGANVFISAPGSEITATGKSLINADGSALQPASITSLGTSFATPIVSGVVALMLEANPQLSYRDVQEILAVSANRSRLKSASSWSGNAAVAINGGGFNFSRDYGFGEVDARAAVRLAETWRTSMGALYTQSTAAQTASSVADLGQQTLLFSIGQNMCVEQAVVSLNITQDRWSDLVVKLISPSGTESILLNQPGSYQGTEKQATNGYASQLSLDITSNQFRGEEAKKQGNGQWQLIIQDKAIGHATSNVSASLQLLGSAEKTINNQYFLTDDYAASPTWIISDPNGGIDELDAAAVTGNIRLDLSAATGSNVAGKTITIQSGIESAIGGDGDDTLIAAATGSHLTGGHGRDSLIGGTGGDLLYADEGADTVTGGGGADLFVVNAQSVFTVIINDFSPSDTEGILVIGTGLNFSSLIFSSNSEGVDATLPNGKIIRFKGLTIEKINNPIYWGFTGNINNIPSPGSPLFVSNNVIRSGVDPIIGSVDIIGHTSPPTPIDTVIREFGGASSGSNLYLDPSKYQFFTIGPGSGRVDNLDPNKTAILSFSNLHTINGLPYTYSYTALTKGVTSASWQDAYPISNSDQSPSFYNFVQSDQYVIGKQSVLNSASWKKGTIADDYIVSADTPIPTGIDSVTWNTKINAIKVNGRQVIDADSGSDTIVGSSRDELIIGGQGNDSIYGGGGNDLLQGGTGTDRYIIKRGDGISTTVQDSPGEGNILEFSDSKREDAKFTVKTVGQLNGATNQQAYSLVIQVGSETVTVLNWNSLEKNIFTTDNSSLSQPIDQIDFSNGSINTATLANMGWSTYGTDLSDLISGLKNNLNSINVNGGTGNDLIVGTGNSDYIDGGNGSDTVFGLEGNDTLIADDSADVLAGGLDNDVYYINTPNTPSIREDLNSGEDTVHYSNRASYTIPTNVENLILDSTNPSTLQGNAASNKITGNIGNDVIIGGSGNDTLEGGGGRDLFTFKKGFGQDTIVDRRGSIPETENSILSFDSTYTIEDLRVTHQALSSDAKISFTQGDSITLQGWYARSTKPLWTALFSIDMGKANNISLDYMLSANWTSGTASNDVLSTNQSNAWIVAGDGSDAVHAQGGSNMLIGAGGDDTLSGGVDSDTMIGGAGSDQMEGGSGDDLYIIDDQDRISESKNMGTDSVVSLAGNYTLPDNVENIQISENAAMSSPESDFSYAGGNELANRIEGNSLNNYLIGNAGDDTIIGGLGNDTIDGGYGFDTYSVSGVDEIFDQDSGNTIQFTSQSPLDHLTFSRQTNDLVVQSSNLMDVAYVNSFSQDGKTSNIKQIQIIDKSGNILQTISGESVLADINATSTTTRPDSSIKWMGWASSESYTGTSLNDWLDGDGGFDSINGGGGRDTIVGNGNVRGGTEDDFIVIAYPATGTTAASTIYGDEGNDVIISNDRWGTSLNSKNLNGGSGDDTIVSGVGNDVLIGGAGNDLLSGGLGNDEYIYSNGDGYDRILSLGIGMYQIYGQGNYTTEVTSSDSQGSDTLTFADLSIDQIEFHRRSPKELEITNKSKPAEGVVLDNFFETDYEFWPSGTKNSLKINSVETIKVLNSAKTGYQYLNRDQIALMTTATEDQDFYYGSEGPNYFDGKGGADVIGGNNGNDSLYGGLGIDQLTGENGNDELHGGDQDDYLYGNQGDDTLYGDAGNDALYGGTGVDSLYGGAGNDSYYFNLGNNIDTITESEGSDSLTFTDIAYNKLWFSTYNATDLIISVLGTSDQTVIRNWQSSPSAHIELIRDSSGRMLSDYSVSSLVNAMASFNINPASVTSMPVDPSLSSTLNWAWRTPATP